MKNKTNTDFIKELESVLTIDGCGRPEKARRLLELLSQSEPETVVALLKISRRKFK